MSYSISEVAEMMGVTAYTLRYYDKEGLLPDVKRVNGVRVFEDKDFAWLRVLNCLRNTNMPLKKIKEYFELAQKGDDSLQQRYEIILEQEENIKDQIKDLKYHLKELEYKKWYYETAIQEGSENVHKNSCNPTFRNDKIPTDKKKES